MKKYYTLFLLLVTISVTNAQTKHVLVEELTGTWCQWCPGGTHYMDSLLTTHPDAIGVAIHCNDAMQNTSYTNASGLTAAPSANIDRGSQGAPISSWFSMVNMAFGNIPKADINVFTNFNPSSRVLTARVKATFFSSISGNYRLSAIITEDGITGPSPLYDQSNYAYSGGANGPMGGFELLPTDIPASMIAYNHVGRALLGEYNGQTGSVPSSLSAGDTASYTFTYTLPANWNANYIRVIGLLLAPNNSIDNCIKSLYLDGNSNAAPLFMSPPMTSAFVGTPYLFDIYASDPDNENLTFSTINLPSWLTLSATTTLGMIHTKATLTGTPASAGNYPVQIVVSDGTRTDTLSFIITVNSSLAGNWELVGEKGFANTEYNMGIVKDINGTLYAFVTSNNTCNVYQKTPSGSWTNYGNLNGQGFMGRICIASDGLTPYVAYSKAGPVVVKKYSAGAWVQVGPSLSNGVQIGFDLDNSDTPYVAFQDLGSGSKGNCYKYNGTSWAKVGGTAYSGSATAVWNDMKINKTNGDVYVLWGNYGNGKVPVVSKWDGNSWSTLGGTNVSTDPVSYSQNIEIDKYTGDVYVVISSGSSETGVLNAYRFNGSSWAKIGSDEASGQVKDVVLAINDERILLIAFVDIAYSNAVSTMSYFDGKWEFVGPRGFSNAISGSCAITSFQNMPFVLYKDGSVMNKATVRYYDSPVLTDVNQYVSAKIALTIYPNPSNDAINITGLTSPTDARIYDMQGSLIWKGIVKENDKINTTSFKHGVYILTTEKGSNKFIVQH